MGEVSLFKLGISDRGAAIREFQLLKSKTDPFVLKNKYEILMPRSLDITTATNAVLK